MDHPIKRDHARFRKIVKGKIRDNLRKYVSEGSQIVPKGTDKFTIPMPSIDIPRFRFGDKSQGGTGQEGKRVLLSPCLKSLSQTQHNIA